MGTTQTTPTLSTKLLLTGGALALVAAVALGLCNGASSYSLAQLVFDDDARTIVLSLRLPRILFGVCVGGTLAVVGAAYQAMFRNSLASPFSLGVSSGAALGASLSLFLGWGAHLSVDVSAVLAAGISIVLILALNRVGARASQDSLLLIGVVFSFFCSSVLTLIQYMSDYTQLFRVSRWMLGGVPVVSWNVVAIAAAVSAATTAWLILKHRHFDLILFGEDFASAKGVDPQSFLRAAFVVTSIAVGWFVAQCGVIGFVGIIVPAAVRLAVGLHHRRVLPLSFIAGALLIVVCDTLGRVVTPPFEVPAGVFTAVLGGPVFVLLLLTSHRRALS